MSAMPDTSLGRRSIEDILLEHGHVTREQVDEVIAAEPEAGRPLGQILVEAGTITRLQLASALAEQWSDSGAPIAPPDGLALSGFPSLPPRPDPATPDQSELLSRLRLVEEALEKLNASDGEDESVAFQAAVAEVSERLSSAEPAIEELGQRLEALAAEAGRDGRVDELLAVVAGLHDRMSSVGKAIDTASQRNDELTAEAATEIERVREDVSALTAALPELAQGYEAQGQDLEKLRGLVDNLGQRPAGDPDLGAQIDDLRAVVEALTERPTSDPVLVAQVDTVALRLAEVGDRVDVLSAAVQSTTGDEEALQELKSALGELAQRPHVDPAADRRVEELAAALEELAQRPQADPAADARIDELAAALEELAQRPLADPEAGQRLDELATTLEELRSSMVALDAKPAGDPALDEKLFEVTARLEELERADVLDELRARVVELAERPAFDPALADRLAELETKFGALPANDVLAELGDGDRALGDRIDGVGARIDERRRRHRGARRLPGLSGGLERGSRDYQRTDRRGEGSRHPADRARGAPCSDREERSESVGRGRSEARCRDCRAQRTCGADRCRRRGVASSSRRIGSVAHHVSLWRHPRHPRAGRRARAHGNRAAVPAPRST